MPYVEVGKCSSCSCGSSTGGADDGDAVPMRIFYRLFGTGENKVILIRGLQGTHEGWKPQLNLLAGTEVPVHNEQQDSPWHCSESSDTESTSECRTSTSSDISSMSSLDSNGVDILALNGKYDMERVAPGEGRGGSDGAAAAINRALQLASAEAARGRQVCIFDNRGAGRSTIPYLKSDYSTSIMAKDAIALMDHLGWQKAHVIGLSMGGMIASKLASIAPHRVRSLALISTSGGKWDAFGIVPLATLAYQFVFPKTKEQIDRQYLCTQFFKETLAARGGPLSVCLLPQVEESDVEGKHANWRDGMKGHHHACWNHCLTSEDIRTIRNGGFLVSLIHGSQDIVAPFGRAVALTKRLAPFARLVAPNGGHLVIQECTAEVNMALRDLLEAAEANMEPTAWSGMSDQEGDEETVKDLPHDETRVQWPEDPWSKHKQGINSLHIPLTLE